MGCFGWYDVRTLPRHKMTDGFAKEERCHICSFMMTSVVRLSLSKRKARQHIGYEIQLISKIRNGCVRGNVVYWLPKVITLKFSKGRDHWQGVFLVCNLPPQSHPLVFSCPEERMWMVGKRTGHSSSSVFES